MKYDDAIVERLVKAGWRCIRESMPKHCNAGCYPGVGCECPRCELFEALCKLERAAMKSCGV